MRDRVFTYITRQDDLLVFDYVDRRYLAPQIPGGTIEPGEAPEVAALREATEETGLAQLEVICLLGCFEQDLTRFSQNETICAWFYHLITIERTPPIWRHFELDPSGGCEPIELECYWVAINKLQKLGGLDDAMLPALCESVRAIGR